MFIVQEGTVDLPLVIIEAEKKENIFTAKYSKLTDAQFIFQLNDGTYSSMLPTSSVKPTKVKTELRKKYKIKTKHLKD